MTEASRYPVRSFVAIALAVVFLTPLVFMVLGSMRTPGLAPPEGFELVPQDASWSNYRSVFAFVPLTRYLVNSLLIVAIAVPVTVVVASWAGFAIAASTPKVRRRLIIASVVALMVPTSALWVPRFAGFRWLGMIDTYWPLVAPALMATTPFYVLLFALAYARLPKTLFEAARLEGMSPFQIWRRVAWPLALPAAFAVAVLAFTWHWANFIDPLLYLSTNELFTVPLGLRALQTLEPTNHPILLAGSVIAALPPVVAFLVAQRSFFHKTLEV